MTENAFEVRVDERKAVINLAKHGVTFEAANWRIRDPFALTELDRDEAVEERWRRIRWHKQAFCL